MANETLTTGATRNRQNPTSDDLLNIARLAWDLSGNAAEQQKMYGSASIDAFSGNRASLMKAAGDVLKGGSAGYEPLNQAIRQAAERHFGSQTIAPATGAGGQDHTFRMATVPQTQTTEQLNTVKQDPRAPQGWGIDSSGHLAKIGTPLGTPTPEIQPPTTGVPGQAPSAPVLQTPQAPMTSSAFLQGAQTAMDTTRKTVEDAYKKQLDDLKIQQETSQKKIDELNTTQQGIIQGDIAKLQEPFRQKLEDAERQRLYINENFEANQKLTNELQTLLTDGNALIKQQQDATSLGAIKNPRLNQTISDVSARAGVLQAVLSARNGQIAQAYNMIDRSVNAINADRQDQLDYFKTLYNFYEGKKGVEQQKLLTLTGDQKKYLDAQIGILENDMTRAQQSADTIKKLITDPTTAKIASDAGITLNDTPEQIGQKFAIQTRKEENKTIAKEIGASSKYVNKNGDFFRVSDGKQYTSEQEFFNDSGVKSFSEAYQRGLVTDYNAQISEEHSLVKQLAAKYPDAFILPNDSLATAKNKLDKSAMYKKDVELKQTTEGLTPAQINATVNQIAGAFDNEPIVKAYNVTQEGFQSISRIGVDTKSPADDIAFIYAFAKIMDPNSVVREGEYNTIQKYAQTWADNFGFTAKRIFSNTNFLSTDAKQKMLNALSPKVQAIESQYVNLRNEYQRQMNDAYAGKQRQITEYGVTPTNQQSPQQQPSMSGFIDDALNNKFSPQDIINELKKNWGYVPSASFPNPTKELESIKKKSNQLSVAIPESSRIAAVHNNPGNLIYVGQKGAEKGEPKQGGGFWAKFSNPIAGFNALVDQIKLDASRGLNLLAFIGKYAPSSENDTGSYINQIAKSLGVSPKTQISKIDNVKLAKAIARKESGSIIT